MAAHEVRPVPEFGQDKTPLSVGVATASDVVFLRTGPVVGVAAIVPEVAARAKAIDKAMALARGHTAR